MGKSRGWLNWLSLGMLGAGGTDGCSQFSGVVSDEVIKACLLQLITSRGSIVGFLSIYI